MQHESSERLINSDKTQGSVTHVKILEIIWTDHRESAENILGSTVSSLSEKKPDT
jgi:hypothetical protein